MLIFLFYFQELSDTKFETISKTRVINIPKIGRYHFVEALQIRGHMLTVFLYKGNSHYKL